MDGPRGLDRFLDGLDLFGLAIGSRKCLRNSIEKVAGALYSLRFQKGDGQPVLQALFLLESFAKDVDAVAVLDAGFFDLAGADER